jgi:PucR-like helix-turn-helix protein/diguanylate cyclase with GGDEF domain
MQRRSTERAPGELHSRLRSCLPEIEDAVLPSVLGAVDPLEALDSDYAEGLHRTVRAVIDYGLAAIELGEEDCPPPPQALLAQVRIAAKNEISLETVLRRYVAGQAVLIGFLVREAKEIEISAGDLQRILRIQAALLDLVLGTISREHARESERRLSFTEQDVAERVERLLAGESTDTSSLAYDFAGHHLGAIAKGLGAGEGIRALAARVDRRLLLVQRGDGELWAWLGGRREIDSLELSHFDAAALPKGVSLVFGEPARGLGGWRFTHRQARAALPIALCGARSLVRYAEVALLASIHEDDLLTTSLRALYLAPLERERDGGEIARETLRAYFSTGRNVSSAAAALKVSRRTVTNRLRAIEIRLGPLRTCATDVEAALQLHDLDRVSVKPPTAPDGSAGAA